MKNIEFVKVNSAEELKEFCLYPEEEFKNHSPYFMVVNKFTKEDWEREYTRKMPGSVYIKFANKKAEADYNKYIKAVYKKLGI